jgi:hemerythrin-like domain-containing protein
MNPTDILSEEHRVIEQVLQCLDIMAEQCKASNQLDKKAALEAIDFIQTFADRCHHGKEEAHLFAMMERHGFSPQSGPLSVMLWEHDVGRSYVKAMEDAAPGAIAGQKEACSSFAENALEFSKLLRAHIYKEDNILYPMANESFSGSDQTELLESFRRVEKTEMGDGTHERYLTIADSLADRFGVPRAPRTQDSCGCSCSH